MYLPPVQTLVVSKEGRREATVYRLALGLIGCWTVPHDDELCAKLFTGKMYDPEPDCCTRTVLSSLWGWGVGGVRVTLPY